MEGRRCEQQGMEGEWGWVTARDGGRMGMGDSKSRV